MSNLRKSNTNLILKSSIVFLISGLLFLIVGIITKTGKLDEWNLDCLNALISIRNPILTIFSSVINFLCEWYFYVILSVALVIMPKTRYKWGIPLFAISFLAMGGDFALKLIFNIPRPDQSIWLIHESGNGFPSGHATYGSAVILFMTYLWIKYKHEKGDYSSNLNCILSCIVSVLLIGFTRVYLGVHDPTDIIGGYLLGFFILSFGIFMNERFDPVGLLRQKYKI